ncbi:hypothetical protein SteCoe_2189 [Stentor coeruleus]|uniref:Uncharacterized protein n=1 Tax=Stentor coeruleus TaxID=5963 RepID=A0A1R2D002_9CILI|nr:hypothetical protein SteCoe_2189 [Stentor coeruleus]
MSLAVVDYLCDLFQVEILPISSNIIVICKDSCFVHDSFLARFSIVADLSNISRGGSFIIKVSGEIQRGLIISLLISKYPMSTIFTPRKEVISKYLPSCKIELLMTPIKQAFPMNVNQPKVVNIPVKEAFPQMGIQKSQTIPKQPPNYFDIVYMESLGKYCETILVNSIRATKQRSCRAQIKNIVDGVIASTRKKVGPQIQVDSEEVTEAIVNDISDHGIFNISAMLVEYNDEEIEAYFGRQKFKKFTPRHRNNGIKAIRNEDVKNQPCPENYLDVIQAVSNLAIQDDRCENMGSIGELMHFIKSLFIGYSNESNRKFNEAQTNQIISQIFRKVLETKFDLRDIKNFDEVCVSPSKNFFIKLVKLDN